MDTEVVRSSATLYRENPTCLVLNYLPDKGNSKRMDTEVVRSSAMLYREKSDLSCIKVPT